MKKEIITVEYKNHKLVADIFLSDSILQVLCMHGAGISNRKIFDPMRDILADKGISSCALDFIGYGETGGKVEESSLQSRTEQAKAIIEKIELNKPIILIAGSMGGYNAIKLTKIFPVSLLILSAPAVYDTEAYDVSFGDKFSAIIREPGSWDKTDAWQILNKYKGKIIILTGENDAVIPAEVIEKIYTSSNNASYREIIKIPNAPHRLVSWLSENPNELKIVTDKIISLL